MLLDTAKGRGVSAYLDLQGWWARTGTKITTEPVSELRLAELESRYDIVIPDDFKEYLRLSSPAEEAWDSENGIWWNFERIKNIPDEYPHDLEPTIGGRANKFLFFADYAVWCWAWAISCNDDESRGKVALIAGIGHDRFVADSFSDFVQKYVSDWRSVC